MRFDDVDDALPDLRERVSDIRRSLVAREPTGAGDPERRIGGDTGAGKHLLYVSVNQIRVEAVSVVRRTKASVLEDSLRPRIVVVAHRPRDSIHALDVEEDDCAASEPFRGSLGDRIVRISSTASRAHELRRAARAP